MKLTKRLIPAFAMLLVSAVLMSTASFAWFSMNDKVTVSGMSITATQTEIFLEISTEQNSGFTTSVDKTITDVLSPIAHDEFTKVADIADPNSWYYLVGEDPTQSAASEDSRTDISTLTGYVAVATYYVRANDKTDATIYDLFVSSVTITGTNGGTSVIIAGPDGYQEFKTSAEQEITVDAAKVLVQELTDTPQAITVYVYIDGAHRDVFTNNADQLGGSVAFTMSAFPTNKK